MDGCGPGERGEYLAEGDGRIWCRRNPDSAWTLQILLGESAGEDWLFRRDPRVRIPIKLLGRRNRDGIPYLTPPFSCYSNRRTLVQRIALILKPCCRTWIKRIGPQHQGLKESGLVTWGFTTGRAVTACQAGS
jgi:hypothetical protein